MNRRQKIIVSITGIFIVMLALVGLTYAYFLTRITGNEEEKSISVTTAKLELVYSDNTPEVNLTGIIPITQDKVKTEGLVKRFTVSKTEESSDVYTTIKLSNLNVSENIALYDMKWALYQGETPISTGDFGGKTTGEIILATNQLINTTTGLEYSLHIWINETNLDQSDMMNGTLSGILDISGTDKQSNTLSSALLGKNKIYVKTGQFNFNTDFICDPTNVDANGDIPCNSNYQVGLYMENRADKTEMGFPTYYYRGSQPMLQDNPEIVQLYHIYNWVSFGTYKNDVVIDYAGSQKVIAKAGDPILWRVVRINENGSIKLITDNPIYDKITWKNTNVDNVDYNNSNVKLVLEDWYADTLEIDTSVDDKVVVGSFCNDTSENYTAANARLKAKEPIFKCQNASFVYNSKIGLLTGDEVFFAGGLRDNYASDKAPYFTDSYGFHLGSPGSDTTTLHYGPLTTIPAINQYRRHARIQRGNSSQPSYVRAVINLSPDVVIANGNGNYYTPYIIES